MTSGPTGGHLYPAIALAGMIKKRRRDAKIMFMGGKRLVADRILDFAGAEHIEVSSASMPEHVANWPGFVAANVAGTMQSARIFRQKRPDFVVSTGGYAAAPVLAAAVLLRLPRYALEQNVVPGKVTKLFMKHLNTLVTSFEETSRHTRGARVMCGGNPVRPELFKADRQQARRTLRIEDDEFVVLAFGGSQGARALNSCVCQAAGSDKTRYILVTGRGAAGMEKRPVTDRLTVFEYVHDMGRMYAAADLVLCRAGATTIAELCALGKPSILVPYPHAAGRHQDDNAKTMSGRKAAVYMDEKDLSAERLSSEIRRLSSDRKLLRTMADNAVKLGRPDAAQHIADYILEDYLNVRTN